MTGPDDPDVKARIDGELAKPDLDLRQQVSAALRQHRIDFDRNDPAQAADHCACGLLITDWDEHWANAVLAVVQLELAELRAGQLYTAWWSARIGRAHARDGLRMLAQATIAHQRRAEQAEATLARVRELAVMGGQDPVLVRQWIVIEIDQARPKPATAEATAEGQDRRDADRKVKIYPVDSGYVVADDAGWVPGHYSTPEAALLAVRNTQHHGSPDDQPQEET